MTVDMFREMVRCVTHQKNALALDYFRPSNMVRAFPSMWEDEWRIGPAVASAVRFPVLSLSQDCPLSGPPGVQVWEVLNESHRRECVCECSVRVCPVRL
jgi:hypothetical protein